MCDRIDLLLTIKRNFEDKPFIPHSIFKQGDAQTIAAHLWPGRAFSRDDTSDETRLFEVTSDTKVLARCRWQTNRTECPTLVIWHGMEGSTASSYMLAMAIKALRAGFN